MPLCVAEAYHRLTSKVFESDELKGLEFIAIQRLVELENDNHNNDYEYLWRHTDHFIAQDNNTKQRTFKKFSYSLLKLEKFNKTDEQLKTDQDKWISLIFRGSAMDKKQVKTIFGEDSMFQQLFEMLELKKFSKEERLKYTELQRLRYCSADLVNFYFMKGIEVGKAFGEHKGHELGTRDGIRMGWKKGFSDGLESSRQESLNDVLNHFLRPVLQKLSSSGLRIPRTIMGRQKLIVLNMLRKGLSIEKIGRMIDWTKEEIHELLTDPSVEEPRPVEREEREGGDSSEVVYKPSTETDEQWLKAVLEDSEEDDIT
jgi:hypothetical protein